MTRHLTSSILIGAGLLLSAIGSALLVAPVAFLATSQVVVANDPGLISELAAPSVILLAVGVFMIIGAFRARLTHAALLSGAFVYGSYGIGRLAAIVLHGVPSPSLVTAMIVEFVIAGLLMGAKARGERSGGVLSTA